MPEIICNTSPMQYLHQLGHLQLLPTLAGEVIVPSAVAGELAVGRRLGLDLPEVETFDWVTIRRPAQTGSSPNGTSMGAEQAKCGL